jgi:two-component system phosphate regulon sensor histidine kinase PhoR
VGAATTNRTGWVEKGLVVSRRPGPPSSLPAVPQLDAVEAVEDEREVLARDADAGVRDPDADRVSGRAGGQGHAPRRRGVDGGASQRPGGSGLGLALVQAIVTTHGGTIQIESEPGQGTVCTVRLPVAPPTL